MQDPHLSFPARIVAAILLLAAAASALAVTFGDTAAAPEDRQNVVIPIHPIGIDFGVVEVGETVNGSVTLLNNGDKPLHVLAAKASCGCTTLPEFKPLTLEPGEKSRIELSLKAPARPGLRRIKHITFRMKEREALKVPLIIETLEEGDA